MSHAINTARSMRALITAARGVPDMTEQQANGSEVYRFASAGVDSDLS